MKKIVKKTLKITGITIGVIAGVVIVAGTIFYFTRKDDFNRVLKWNKWLDNAVAVLQQSAPYDNVVKSDYPQFVYQSVDNQHLVRVREYFRLDTLFTGNEVQTIKNLMYFVHNNIQYDGSYYYDGPFNSISLYEFNKNTGNGINCRMMATTLNEVYLAAGFRSHFVTCMPADTLDTECHVINSVWSESLGKWIWMDPSFAAFVDDGQGNLLGIGEVRERLKTGLPVKANPDINFNGRPYDGEYYLQKYMAKNLYWFNMWSESRFNLESLSLSTRGTYIALTPVGYSSRKRPWDKSGRQLETHNSEWFWMAPDK